MRVELSFSDSGEELVVSKESNERTYSGSSHEHNQMRLLKGLTTSRSAERRRMGYLEMLYDNNPYVGWELLGERPHLMMRRWARLMRSLVEVYIRWRDQTSLEVSHLWSDPITSAR